jgi:4-amino-4-deoxy-L-arabinose transferase-like glycosyltransferase
MKRFRISVSLTVLVLIFVLGTVIRFIGLGTNPVGIVDDEADAAYDAYSLIHTGKDQWAVSWPVTSFRGFGDYRLPVYTYLSIPSITAFGLTPFAIRFPSAFFGSLTILVVYILVKELFGRSQETLALLSAFLMAVSPWHIGMSRIGLEETTSVFFVTCGMWALLVGRRHGGAILAGTVLLGVSLYVYTSNIVFVPLLVALAVYLFRKAYTRFRWQLSIGGVCFVLLLTGLLIFTGTGTAATRTRQVNLTNNPALIDVVNEKQGACRSVLPSAVCRLVFNKYSAYGTKFVTNYLNHFSPNLLAVYGTDTQYSVLPGRGLLYLFDYPLLIVALVVVFLAISPARLLLVGWLFLSAIPDSFTSDGQYGRYFISYPVWPILTATAIVWVLSHIKYRNVVLSFAILCFLTAAGSFVVEYWTFFPYRYSQFSHFGYEELIQKILSNTPLYDRIVVSSRVNDSKQYIYYLFYTRYDAATFQSGKGIEKVLESNGWVRVKRIHSIEFAPALPGLDDIVYDHELLIGAPSEFPESVPNVIPAVPVPVEFTVKDKAGNILFEAVDTANLYSAAGTAK